MKVIRNTWQTWQGGKFRPLTHSVAKANAIRCDGKVNAFRWPMQCIASRITQDGIHLYIIRFARNAFQELKGKTQSDLVCFSQFG